MNNTKFCINCVNYFQEIWDQKETATFTSKCKSPHRTDINLVTGLKEEKFCGWERNSTLEDHCGLDARFFVPKNP